MKKWLLMAAVAATAISGLAQAKEWKVVRFGIEGAYPPFSWTEADGSLRGFDVDMANALCQEMQVECRIVPQDWDGIIPSLLARKYDAIIAAMSITEERKKRIDFTHKYALIPNRFIAKKGAELDFSPQGLKDVKIGVQRATTHDKYLTDNYGKSINIVRYGSFDEAYLDLANGRISAVLGDASALEEGVLNKVGGEAYEFVGPSLTDPQWFGEGFGIAVRKQDKDLTKRLNQAIVSLREQGIYQKIAAQYFSYDVYGD
ncbi:transporter substrate-binding domain-containing protein [Vibrio sp. V27_P1S3P104]|uniref:ABC transporter substrate-binding protein n=1 Tax=unclassified Vibrio TaxID=2614977 RepID=UPI0013726626|nr:MULTISPECIES: ABC transporter substrate-binding protein [unclassified Vibrio]NAW69223.1 transporter substrate-binding domain-containing protein [Vibrio sp. V28_P6S34P95]NAX04372.1 transporter substrate-binding domain-containing protein [Vibrio sp. V30_P3S12P165]NAX35823.1 transporter substrate-binding domain-containing protein [Vibrio sp. V29_P1S30P107]NAX37346.1 transporter substrate-binding domain-containing protein [Vibrio sp. V27_P1S3P104]NAX39178.1 transporter substrate-binding domain-